MVLFKSLNSSNYIINRKKKKTLQCNILPSSLCSTLCSIVGNLRNSISSIVPSMSHTNVVSLTVYI